MKKFEKIFFSMIAMIMLVAVGSVFTSCTNDDDDFPVPVQETQLDQALGQDSVATMTRATNLSLEEQNGWDMKTDLGSSYGYKLYRKDGPTLSYQYRYLQKVNFSLGSRIVFASSGNTQNSSIPYSPNIQRQPLSTFWTNKPENTISATNCSFFIYSNSDGEHGTNYTPISHPLKNSGSFISIGSCNDESNKKKLGFSSTTKEAWIAPYNITSNNYYLINNDLISETVACGLSPTVNKRAGYLLKRTMVGIKNQDDPSGKKEVMYILTGVYKQADAVNELINLGCDEDDIIMFDGHNSSQMKTSSYEFPVDHTLSAYSTKRNIPTIMYIVHN